MFHLNFTIMDKDKIKDFFESFIGTCRIVIPALIFTFGFIYLDTKLKEQREIENPGYYIFAVKENHKSERLLDWAPMDSVKSYFEASAISSSGYSHSLFYCLLKSGNVAIFCQKGDFSERVKQSVLSSASEKKEPLPQQDDEDDAVDIIRTYMQTIGNGNVPF